jgi:hypothetical protein
LAYELYLIEIINTRALVPVINGSQPSKPRFI